MISPVCSSCPLRSSGITHWFRTLCWGNTRLGKRVGVLSGEVELKAQLLTDEAYPPSPPPPRPAPPAELEVQRVNWHSQESTPESTAQFGNVRNLKQELRSKSLSPKQCENTKEATQIG